MGTRKKYEDVEKIGSLSSGRESSQGIAFGNWFYTIELLNQI